MFPRTFINTQSNPLLVCIRLKHEYRKSILRHFKENVRQISYYSEHKFLDAPSTGSAANAKANALSYRVSSE